jgi:glycosyltransferase involved in cell wall biosynthesis
MKEKTARDDKRGLHVVHAVLSLDVGGLERLVLGMIRESRKRGHDASVICIESPGALAAAAREAGAEVFSLDKPPGRRPEFKERGAELLARLSPDVLHTHQIGAAWYLGPSAVDLRIPVLHTEHGNHFGPSESWLTRMRRVLLYRKVGRRVRRICCVSEEIADELFGHWIAPPSKLTVVNNGVDFEAFVDLPTVDEAREQLGIPFDARVVGTVGRLAELKRQDLLLRAAAELRDRFSNLWLLFVGDGPERNRLEQLARELGLAERCTFAGFQPHPEFALRAMDVFVLTSRSEGFPVSLLEAWAAGVPVVASRVGGIGDVVADQETGLLVEPDDPTGYRPAIDRLLADRRLAAAMAKSAKNALETRYSLTRMVQRYESEYRALMRSAPGARVCAS